MMHDPAASAAPPPVQTTHDGPAPITHEAPPLITQIDYARAGVITSAMRIVAEKERRDQVLLADQERRGVERNSALVGTVRDVLVEGPSKRMASRLSGRDGGNRIVVWDAPEGCRTRAGSIVRVKIAEAHPQTLVGEAC